MSNRRTITIELSDDEYRRLEEEAIRSGSDMRDIIRSALVSTLRTPPASPRPASSSEDVRNDDSNSEVEARRKGWEEALAGFARVRANVRPWGPGEFEQFLEELREERDARP